MKAKDIARAARKIEDEKLQRPKNPSRPAVVLSVAPPLPHQTHRSTIVHYGLAEVNACQDLLGFVDGEKSISTAEIKRLESLARQIVRAWLTSS